MYFGVGASIESGGGGLFTSAAYHIEAVPFHFNVISSSPLSSVNLSCDALACSALVCGSRIGVGCNMSGMRQELVPGSVSISLG